jgi:alpha-beta hydrolase superfamily lysophospholipase
MPARVRVILKRAAWAIALIVGTLAVGGAIQAVLMVPDLSEWHRFVPSAEVTASDLDESFTLDQYRQREDALFAEVQTHLDARSGTADARATWSRFVATSPSAPARAPQDWNRTFEVVPPTIRAGALLIHGLTDAPYSMRALADDLHARGVYALALRMPGHGTVPGGLTAATSEDWMAAVRMGARHVSRRVGADRPLILVGYSNGGALVAQYAIEALSTPSLPQPSALVLVSPMIGVSPMARLARTISILAPVPGLEKAGWLDVIEEFNPFKYNSFPANAARQSFRVSSSLHSAVSRAITRREIDRLPPVLAFQSIVDATVSTPALVRDFFDRLPAGSHELVVFDINRLSGLESFIRPSDAALVAQLSSGAARRYRRTLITNVTRDTLDVKAISVEAGTTTRAEEALPLAWPRDLFSLSHVALPFREDDPVYGANPPVSAAPLIALGRLSPRGERAVLTVPMDMLMRITWNPFFPYMTQRIGEMVESVISQSGSTADADSTGRRR